MAGREAPFSVASPMVSGYKICILQETPVLQAFLERTEVTYSPPNCVSMYVSDLVSH